MPQVTSKDGTVIAYDKSGNGPLVIIVNGAFGYRDYYGDRELASALSQGFTVIIYDRRGRGESTDTQPYAVEREIEDIEALTDAGGGQAFLYGVSSGAALALKAAARLSHKVTRLAMFEPPYGTDDPEAREEFARLKQQTSELLAAGNRGDAVALFMADMMTPEQLGDFRKTPEWQTLEAVAPTLGYEYAILDDGTPPVADARGVSIPALVMNGSDGLPFIQESIEAIAGALPRAERKTLEGEPHQPSVEAMAPVLAAFFG
jgi:pimeloyl-ACP methyl ester carboxylesterase